MATTVTVDYIHANTMERDMWFRLGWRYHVKDGGWTDELTYESPLELPEGDHAVRYRINVPADAQPGMPLLLTATRRYRDREDDGGAEDWEYGELDRNAEVLTSDTNPLGEELRVTWDAYTNRFTGDVQGNERSLAIKNKGRVPRQFDVTQGIQHLGRGWVRPEQELTTWIRSVYAESSTGGIHDVPIILRHQPSTIAIGLHETTLSVGMQFEHVPVARSARIEITDDRVAEAQQDSLDQLTRLGFAVLAVLVIGVLALVLMTGIYAWRAPTLADSRGPMARRSLDPQP